MSKFMMLAAATLLLSSTAAFAQTGAATPATPATSAAPAQKSTSAPVNTSQSHKAAPDKMAKASTKTGKAVTYNCAKAGNKNKAACKAHN